MNYIQQLGQNAARAKKQEERDIMRLNLAGGGLPKPNRVISPEAIRATADFVQR